MDKSTQRDFTWAEKHLEEIKAILKENAMHLLEVQVASEEEDLHQATDMVISVRAGDVAVRVRKPTCTYRDWTIRKSRPGGTPTELEKIQEGYASWYLYCWTSQINCFKNKIFNCSKCREVSLGCKITEWILVDLSIVRKCGILDREWKTKPNVDDSSDFICIPVKDLLNERCLLNYQLENKPSPVVRPTSQQTTLFE